MTISLRLDEQMARKLAAAARARGLSKSELIRECLNEYLAAKEKGPTAWELGKDLFGCFNSGRGDLSTRAKEIAEHIYVPSMPRKVVVDSGPLIALFDSADEHHTRAIEFVRKARATLLSTMAAVTEAMYVLRDLTASVNLLEWLHRGGVTLIEPQEVDFGRISELMKKHADLPMDFTDAVIVNLCETLGTPHIASIDRDFSIYRFKGRSRFVNVF